MLHTGLQMVTGGRGLHNRYRNQPGHTRIRQLKKYYPATSPRVEPAYGRKLTFDKLSNVYNSGTAHDEDQPCHLQILQPDAIRAVLKNTAILASSSVPPLYTKWQRMPTAATCR